VVEAIFGGWFSSDGFDALNIPRNVVLRHDVTNSGINDGVAVYSRDQWGLRGAHKTPDQIDVLVVGGSTTNELYVDNAKIWTAVLQQKFADSGRTLMIANGGVDGHSTVGHLNSFDLWYTRVPKLKPKFVLFYVGINDVQVEEHVRYDTITPKTTWGMFRRFVSNNSALNGAFRTLRGMIRAKNLRLVYLKNSPNVAPIDETPIGDKAAYRARIGKYRERLTALSRKVVGWGARPIFVTQRRGDAFTIDGQVYASSSTALTYRVVQNLFNTATMQLCREIHAICIDLAKEIDLTAKDFADPVHTNPAGSRKIGEYLYRRLKNIL